MFKRYAKIIIIGFVLALFLLPSYVYAEAPPQATAFSLSPKEVNTKVESQEVTVTLALKDDFAGVGYVWLYLTPEAGSTQVLYIAPRRVSGDDLNGIYKGAAKLPVGSQEGVWSVRYLYLVDKIGNSKYFSKKDIESLFGTGSTSITNVAKADTSAPQVTSFSLTPKEVNTSVQSQEVTLTASLTDDFAGVRSGWICIYLRPESGTTQGAYISLRRVSGDALSGTYIGATTLPVGSQNGVWSVTALHLWDNVGNYKYLPKTSLESLFGTGSTSITNVAKADTSAPQVTSFSLTPKEVNTESESQKVTLTASLTDDWVGVRYAGIYLRPESGTSQSAGISLGRVSGDALSGTYKGTTTLPVGSKKGVWSVRYLYLSDKINNYKYVYKTSLESLFGAGSVSITNTASFDDTTPPEFAEPPAVDPSAPNLTHFTLTPRVVSSRNSDQKLNLLVELTDDKEGVFAKGDKADPSYTGASTMMRLRPDTGGNEKIDFVLERISGDDLKGTYRAKPIMPKGSTEGVWRVDFLYLVDKKGNHRFLSAAEIDALLPGRQYTTIINKGQEGVGPKTYVKDNSVKAISKKKAPRYLKLYRHYRSKYTKTKNRTLRKRYKKAANKYLRAYKDSKNKVVTASLTWHVKDYSSKAYVKLKIQKRVKSKLRVKKKARYLKAYRKYRGKYKIYKKKYRKTRNRTLRRRYQKAAVKYKRAMNKYLRAYRRTKTVVYKTVKTANYRWTHINKWRKYNFRTRSRGAYKYYVYAKDKAGNSQQNIARGSFRIR